MRSPFGSRRERGRPPSANGASSLHLRWSQPLGPGVVEAAVTLEVVVVPVVARLYFWALQASFVDGATVRGAAHLGLQWHPSYPESRAANFGGYRHGGGGGELDGSVSARPSAAGNANTCNLAWEPGRPYRLAITRAPGGGWVGSVDGDHLRSLSAGGAELANIMVWSEVFARCDDPAVVARWSALEAVTATGERLAPDRLTVSYQGYRAGGCTNTTVRPDGDGVLQITNTRRDIGDGAVVPFGDPIGRPTGG